jgi:hypothetical protein
MLAVQRCLSAGCDSIAYAEYARSACDGRIEVATIVLIVDAWMGARLARLRGRTAVRSCGERNKHAKPARMWARQMPDEKMGGYRRVVTMQRIRVNAVRLESARFERSEDGGCSVGPPSS